LMDVIHSVSHDSHRNLLGWFPSLANRGNRLVVIPNGIALKPFQQAERRDYRRELHLPDDTFLIGFLGRFMPPKGFCFLVDALELLIRESSLPKTPVILAFQTGGYMAQEIRRLKEMRLDRYVHFLPFTPNVASALRGLDVVTIPSLWEACPLLPMEAMVAGVPVIGTTCPGLREVLANTPSVMCPPGDAQALAVALSREINNPTRQAAESFRQEAARRFNVRTQVRRLEDIILELLKERRDHTTKSRVIQNPQGETAIEPVPQGATDGCHSPSGGQAERVPEVSTSL